MGLNVGVYVKKDILILRLKGELDDVSVTDLRMRISNYIDSYKINHLVLNLAELHFLDSSGIGFIIGRYHQLKKRNGDITISNINSKIERIAISIEDIKGAIIDRFQAMDLLYLIGVKIK